MKKIAEYDIFKEAANQMISNPNAVPIEMPTAIPVDTGFPSKSNGFNISATPGAIVGAILGAAFGRKAVKQNVEKQMRINNIMGEHRGVPATPSRNMPRGFEGGNYYNQMNHLTNNLKVIFTPISAVYIVKDKNREITLDTIETEEMNEDMYNAWKNKDYNYFKNLMVNKMYSEIQFVEKAFAKKVLEKQMGLQKKINKTASIDEVDMDDLTDVEFFHYASATKSFFEKSSELTEKIAEAVIDDFDDNQEYILSEAKLDRPFDKYAGVISDALGMIGLQGGSKDISSLQGKYLNPSYLGSNVRVGFFPDRVIFIVDGKMISTLTAMSMNEEGFNHFQNKDSDYFTKYFKKEVRKGIARLNDKLPSHFGLQEKVATESEKVTVESSFVDTNISPVVYFLMLTAKYGYEWVDFDGHALVQIIEKDFALTRPIGDIPLNKIMSVKVASNGDAVYTSRHAFEKVIRSFSNKPIDFLSRESDDMDIIDFVYGLDTLNRVTPYDNIYDNFSPEVYDYIVKVLADKENYVWGVNVTGTAEEEQFTTMLNYSLLSELNNRFTSNVSSESQKNDIIKENELVFNVSLKLINAVNEKRIEAPEINVGDFARGILSGINIDKDVSEIIINQVVRNTVLDTMLDNKEEELMSQLRDLELHK